MTGALTASALLLTACATSSANPRSTAAESTVSAAAGAPVDGGDLVWGIETKLSSVNPHRNGQDKAAPILRNVFDSYLHRTDSGEYEPWLADYATSEDGLTVTLTLRDGVTFSDGAALDAAAVVANFDKVTSDGYLSSIPGGLRFLTGYEATDDSTVVFTLERPDSLFLLYLSAVSSSPLSPASLELDQSVLEAGGPQLAGTGPFTIESFAINTELALTRRRDYAWAPASIADGQGAAHLDTVTYRTLAEGSTRSGALLQGQLDISSDIQPLDVALVESTDGFHYERNLVSGLPYALYLNVSKAPLNDPLVREAFVKGADVDAIVASIYGGAFERASAPISAVGPFADPSLEGWAQFDADRANEALDAAGWSERNDDGIRVKDGTTLTIRAVSGAPYVRESREQLNIALGAALKQNVGIDYQFQIEDLGTESERADANDYEIFDNSYGGADPASGLDLLYYSSDPSRGFIARGKFDDTALEALIDQGRFATSLDDRKAAYTDLQTLVTKENFYVLPLYQTQDNIASSSAVNGLTIDGATGQPFSAYTVWLSE